jgi:hypothetical protein
MGIYTGDCHSTLCLTNMSIPVIDLSNPDVSALAKEVKDACVVCSFGADLTTDLGLHVSEKPWN